MKKQQGKKSKNATEIREEKVIAVMPEMKRLVSEYGISPVSICLSRIKAYRDTMKEVARKKSELAELEKKLK